MRELLVMTSRAVPADAEARDDATEPDAMNRQIHTERVIVGRIDGTDAFLPHAACIGDRLFRWQLLRRNHATLE
jgi:hypothetical protein